MPTVAINGAGAVTIPQLVNVNLSHRTFTRISAIISVSTNALAYFLTTSVFNVSNLAKYSYFVGWVDTAISGILPMQPEVSPDINFCIW